MTRSSEARIIRKRSRKVHKFEPILSRMSHCDGEVCNDCMAAMQAQVDGERPGHVWTVIDGKLVYMEDMIVERRLGRKLKPNETVVHRNENPLDNRDENLEVVTIEGMQ
jgi:HNH endonuclease